MDEAVSHLKWIEAQLLAEGVLDQSGPVDAGFYALRLGTQPDLINQALLRLADKGALTAQLGWRCQECDYDSVESARFCGDCGKARSAREPSEIRFLRPRKPRRRDPAAVFLIHGMNTLGDWQQSLAWKIQLVYGYSVPVFVFKFGRDELSPLLRPLQNRRARVLAKAVNDAEDDLRRSGRTSRCDVIAHSFGTLLLAHLLSDPKYENLVFGKVVLCGSLIPRTFQWRGLLDSGRVEAVLNHRAGKDRWVKWAPLFFPGADSTGRDRFEDGDSIEDVVSPLFGHSDYFSADNFDTTIAAVWTPFLNRVDPPRPAVGNSPAAGNLGTSKLFWVGRALVVFAALLATFAILLTLAVTGSAISRALTRLGL